MKTFLVGGAVRDIILGKVPKDRDFVVVGSTKEELLAKNFEQVGKDFPVFLHPETKDEFALARTEVKTGSGHTGFSVEFGPEVTLEEDLKRRDLTINAIALDESNNTFVDPFGGKKDLENKILRPVGEAFMEDPVRVLRIARFFARFEDFALAPEVFPMIERMKIAGELDHLKSEQVFNELRKVLQEKKPSLFFEALKTMNVLENIFPFIHKLVGVEQVKKFHPEGCAFTHVMMVLDKAREMTNNEDVLFACLMHDFGKGVTPKEILPKHIGHEEAGLPLVQEFCKRFRIPRKTQNFCEVFCVEHLRMHRIEEMTPKKILALINKLRVQHNKERLENLILCAKADDFGKLKEVYPQGDFLRKCVEAVENVDKKAIAEKNPKRAKEEIHVASIRAIEAIR